MTVHLDISPELETQLRALAASEGQDLASYLRRIIEDSTAEPGGANRSDDLRRRSPDERITSLRAWAASHSKLPYVLDDRREAIYEGRGE